MKLSVPARRLVAMALLATAVVAVPVAAPGPVAAAACSYCAGGEFHSITPTRIFDTRSNGGGPINDVAPNGAKPATTSDPTYNIDLLGTGWLPGDAQAADVLGVVVSITVVSPTVAGWVGAYPAGSPPAVKTSILNFNANQTVANLAIVRPGSGGQLTLQLHGNSSGSMHLLVDVSGWFSTSGYFGEDGVESTDERGGRLIAVTPGRILDTRPVDFQPHPGIYSGEDLALQIRGATVAGGGTIVPNDASVTGVLINLTAVRPSGQAFVSVVPDAVPPGTVPSTSNLNVAAMNVRAVMVMVPVGDDGKIHLYNYGATNNLLVDVLGYVKDQFDDTRAGRVIPLTAPFRAFDTRQAEFQGVALGPGQAEDWSFAAFANSVNIGGTAVGNQSALLGNLTNARLTRQYPTVSVDPSYLTVYPTPPTQSNPPTFSNLNSYESGPVPNMALVAYGSSYQVRVFNSKGYAHYILDVSAVVLAD